MAPATQGLRPTILRLKRIFHKTGVLKSSSCQHGLDALWRQMPGHVPIRLHATWLGLAKLVLACFGLALAVALAWEPVACLTIGPRRRTSYVTYGHVHVCLCKNVRCMCTFPVCSAHIPHTGIYRHTSQYVGLHTCTHTYKHRYRHRNPYGKGQRYHQPS